ncbi:hypothetical protein [Stratiformator vulcanicus]|uniref:Uncharacterized protein n=1 Tax=Stratiformator vulcanicus TaxID=2527980 RepID=A0A517R6Y2_9PLAN|nr:hypothetical protein [Stratiformator vulcanicus]QDT39657.1 hypothetical protein Pan189_40660 [Stratiformator vulcanicus]
MRWVFDLFIDGVDCGSESFAEQLFASSEDASPGMCSGRHLISFDREASTLDEAVRTAVADLRRFAPNVEIEEVRVEGDSMRQLTAAT